MNDAIPENEDAPKNQRLPFDQELSQRSRAFMQETLDAIPELESLAVVYGYSLADAQLPYAMVFGQSGPLRTPTEIVHISQQLFKTLNFQLQKAGEYIQHVDQLMAARAAELKILQEQLDHVQKEIDGAQTTLEQRDRAAADGDSAGEDG